MALASFHFRGRLPVTGSPVTWCLQDPKNSLDSPPHFQSPRTSELRAELGWPGHGQQGFDRAGQAAPVCHVMVRPCCSVSFVEAGPGSDPRPFCWVPIPPPPGRPPSPPLPLLWQHSRAHLLRSLACPVCDQSPTVSVGEHPPEPCPDYLICPDETLSSAEQRRGRGLAASKSAQLWAKGMTW